MGSRSDRCVGLSGVPTQFVDAVRQRLLSLTPSAFALVQAAAVWNHRFGVDEAAELLGNMDSGTAMRSLGQAVDVGLLTESRSGFLFQITGPRSGVRRCCALNSSPAAPFLRPPSPGWRARSHHRGLGTSLLAREHGDVECIEVLREPAADSESDTAADLLARSWDLTHATIHCGSRSVQSPLR